MSNPDDPRDPSYSPDLSADLSAESVSFGAPGAVPPAAAPDLAPDMVAEVLPEATRPRRRRWVLGGALAGVAVVGAGAAFAVTAFMSGGGAQPDEFVPADSIAFMRVDLDPSAGQKIEAYRFLRKFPDVDPGSGEGDLFGQVVQTLLNADPDSATDYERDIEPWLGKRAGVAVVPATAGGDPEPMVVLQVTDEDEARSSLRRLLDEQGEQAEVGLASIPPTGPGGAVITPNELSDVVDSSEPAGLVVRDGWALVGANQERTEQLSAAAQTASLADDPTYAADVESLGDPGVASGWVDLSAAAEQLDIEEIASVDGPVQGRFVAAVRFTGGSVELAGRSIGGQSFTGAEPGGALLASLPADSTAGFGIGVPEDYAERLGDLMAANADAAEAAAFFGLDLPDDLVDALGDGAVLAVGEVGSGSGSGQVAVKVKTDDPVGSAATVQRILRGLREAFGTFMEVPRIASVTGDGVVVHSEDAAYARSLTVDGGLGADPTFVEAVPDASTATTAGYVNLDRIREQLDNGDLAANLEPLRAIGLTMHAEGDDVDLKVRVLVR